MHAAAEELTQTEQGETRSLRLCVISHAYREVGYRPILASIANFPGVELGWITPARYMVGVDTFSGAVQAGSVTYQVYALPIHLAARQGTYFYDTAELRRALDAFNPTIILHEQEVFAFGAAQIAHVAASRGVPLVMFVWENIARQLAWPRRLLMRYVFRRCAALISGSHQAAENHRAFGYTGPIEAISQMGPSMNPQPVFGRRGCDGLQVCFAGRLVRDKGVDCLLRALAELKRRAIPASCTIAGRGPLAETLAALAGQLGIAERVTFLGSIPLHEVAAMLRRSDVLVLPSRRTKIWEEQFGRILTEAMAEATVTLGSRTGAIPEVIGSDELLFEEDDATMLADMLTRLATEPEFLEEQQRALWIRARDHFQMDVLTQRRMEFLAGLVGSWHVHEAPR